MRLDPAREVQLVDAPRRRGAVRVDPLPGRAHLQAADRATRPTSAAVELEIDLAAGQAAAEVLGADRTHEYITENADYRS